MSSSLLIDKNSPYCPGCGHLNVTLNLAKAIESLNIGPLDVIVVSDIGCCGLIDPSLASHTIHGLHGRACALASGISLAIENPNKKIIAVQGDGGATIGIAHLLEAARRNFNVTLIVNNNQIYGMTGGQLSGLSSENFQHEHANINEPISPFNLIELAKSAGASYTCQLVGKGDFSEYLKKAITINGFSIIEILEVCPSYGYQKYSEIENLGFGTTEFTNERKPFKLNKAEIKSLINFNESKIFFENGALEVERNYVDDKLQGKSKVYYDFGTVALEANYKNDILDGTSYFYYPDGSIKVIDTYDMGQIVKRERFGIGGKFDKVEESFTEYYDEGTIKSELNFREGKLNGRILHYYPSGSIKADMYFENGKQEKEARYYYDGGLLKEIAFYIGGMKNGLAYKYNKEGLMSTVI